MPSFGTHLEFKPQYQVSLVEQTAEFLTKKIFEGHLKGGQQLIENELQRKFAISRAPIREAFRILEKKGLVSIIPRKGTYVRKITLKDIKENYPILSCLEGLAAYYATSNLMQKDFEEMELALLKMSKEAKRNTFDSYYEHHNKFHNIFINASKNDSLIALIENLRHQSIWFRISYLWHQENLEYAIPSHCEILNSFISKDAECAKAAVEQHVMTILKRFADFIASKNIQ